MTENAPVPPTVALGHGAVMPRIGLGTAGLGEETATTVVAAALEMGYRLVDTAFNYHNEKEVGAGLRASKVDRGEVFVTTKFNKESHSRDGVRRAFAGSAKALGVDYLDLLLIHWPNPGQDRYVDAWRGLIHLLEKGDVRAIGVSNFKPAHLQRIIDETGVVPDVNQIQLNPGVTRSGARAFHAEHGIVTESWSPLGPGTDLLSETAVTEAADRHGVSPTQVVLRWHLQLGLVAIPRSGNLDHVRVNLDVFDFALTQEEIDRISALDQGEEQAADSDAFGH